ncbi:MAG TPA: tripartite tricarboxylate transporter TctB family protein [Xanthobacteraceae bacterium]|nr:tripartite tricarboxylate transporter TctB family protein [Xanthobacteraceae bacterium]
MSEGARSSGAGRRDGSFIGSPRDFWGGLVLVAVAFFALYASYDLPGMRGFAFGPGTAPRMFAVLLACFGLIVMATGAFTKGPDIDPGTFRGTLLGAALVAIFVLVSKFTEPVFVSLGYRNAETIAAAVVVFLVTLALARGASRGLLFVVASILIFAGTIRTLGLILASFISIVVCAHATHEVRWRETVIWAAALTAFCTFLFPYALNLPFPLWPRY